MFGDIFMKNLLSIILVFILMLNILVISTINTNAWEHYLTTKEGNVIFITEDINNEIGLEDYYIFGYLGDTNNDEEITILDATAIQHNCAELLSFRYDEDILADVDGDNLVCILDATEIQRWLARISNNNYISYTLFSNAQIIKPKDTFDEISKMITNNGEYVRSSYCISHHEETAYRNFDFSISYITNKQKIVISYIIHYNEVETVSSSYVEIEKNNPYFYFSIMNYNSSFLEYICDGYGIYSDMDLINDKELKLNCVNYESTWNKPDLVFVYQASCADLYNLFDFADAFLSNYISGSIYDTIYTTKSLSVGTPPVPHKEYSFSELAMKIILDGKHIPSSQDYTLYLKDTSYSISLSYYPLENKININTTHWNSNGFTYDEVNIYKETSGFYFCSLEYNRTTDSVLFETLGTAKLIDADTNTFSLNCTDLESDIYSDFSEVEDKVVKGINNLLLLTDFFYRNYPIREFLK